LNRNIYNDFALASVVIVAFSVVIGLGAQGNVLTFDDITRLAKKGSDVPSPYHLKVEDVISTTNKDSPRVLRQATTSFFCSSNAKIMLHETGEGGDHFLGTSVASNSTYYSLMTGTHGATPITPELYIQQPHARFFGYFEFIDKQLFCDLLGQLRNPTVRQPDATTVVVTGETTEFRLTNLMTIKISMKTGFRIESVNQVFPNNTVVDTAFIDGTDAGNHWRYRQIVGMVQGASAFGEHAYTMTATPSTDENGSAFPAVSVLEGLKKGAMIHDERQGTQNIYRYKGEILTPEKAKVEHNRVETLRTTSTVTLSPRRWVVIVALALLPIIFASIWRLQRGAKPKAEGQDGGN
jgi:hypothetical protein